MTDLADIPFQQVESKCAEVLEKGKNIDPTCMDGKRLDGKGRDEGVLLAGPMEIAESGVTQAEHLLAAYHGPWKRDIRRAFAEVRL